MWTRALCCLCAQDRRPLLSPSQRKISDTIQLKTGCRRTSREMLPDMPLPTSKLALNRVCQYVRIGLQAPQHGVKAHLVSKPLTTSRSKTSPPADLSPSNHLLPPEVALWTLQGHPKLQALLSLLPSEHDMQTLTCKLKSTWRQDLQIVQTDFSTLQSTPGSLLFYMQ